MFHRRLVWRIYLWMVVTALLALLGTAFYASRSLARFYEEQVAQDLLVRAQILGREPALQKPALDPAAIDRLCKDVGRLTGTRITVILPDGRILGDSQGEPAQMENHADRPEMAAALAGKIGRSVRFSDTLRRSLMYIATPVQQDGRVVAAIRTSLPLTLIDWEARTVRRHIGVATVIAAILFAVVALYLARKVTRPLEEMQEVARSLTSGDLSARTTVSSDLELAALGQSLNTMAAQLGDRLDAIVRQRNELQAVLSSMTEGVLTVDCQERIMDVNLAAARLLDMDSSSVRGVNVSDGIRNLELQVFIKSLLRQGCTGETEITLHGKEPRTVHLRGALLTDAAGSRIGVVVVLSDATRTVRA